MTISTLNGVLAGFQPGTLIYKGATPTLVVGRPQSLWAIAGLPGPGSYNGTLAGANYSSSSAMVNGQIPHTDPAGGVSAYLARFQIHAGGNGGVTLLCDRIWDNQLTINSTGAQTINTAAWPARDATGTTNGVGIVAAIEVSAATSATAAALTNYTYTNQSGVASRTGNFIDAPTAVAANAGQFYRLALQSPDTGIQSIQSIQFSTAWTTGTVNMVAYRVLSVLENPLATTPNFVDPVTSGLPQLFNGVVPFLVHVPNLTTATGFQGWYMETQG
jgi:hypothetical protein